MTIDLSEPRTQRAIYLAADASSWIRCQSQTGERVWGIPSSQAGKFWLTSETSCDCPSSKWSRGEPCKHSLSVQLYTAMGGR